MSFFRLDIREQIRILWNRLGAIGNRVTTLEGSSGGVTDHGALTGLSDDDHSQYTLLAGRAAGQSIMGGTGASENLTLFSTTHGIKGKILFGTSAYNEVDNYFGVGIATPISRFNVVTNSLGVTQAITSGIVVANNTDAAVGAQQLSPAIGWRGRGWKTNATAASQTVDFITDVLPVQGAANPTGLWQLKSSINAAAYGTLVQVSSDSVALLADSRGLNIGPLIHESVPAALYVSKITFPQATFKLNSSTGSDNGGITVLNGNNTQGNLILTQNNYTPINNRKAAQFYMESNGAGGVMLNSSGASATIDFVTANFASVGSSVLAGRFTASGQLGIGVSSPSAKLDVADIVLAGSGSLAASVLNLVQTWNTSGIPTAIKLNVTDTASNAASKLIDLQVGAATKFNVDKAGNLVHSGVSRTAGYTVATLPAAPTMGDRAFVTDALTPTWGTLAVGGGAVVVPVFYDGTIWITA